MVIFLRRLEGRSDKAVDALTSTGFSQVFLSMMFNEGGKKGKEKNKD